MELERLKYVIALQCLYPNNPKRIRTVLETHGNEQEAWEKVQDKRKAQAKAHAEREMEFIIRHGIQTYYYQEQNYPYRLRECPDAPVLLFGKGNLNLNESKFVSVVGTRLASENGKEMTRQLVLDLAQKVQNITIISGLAYGIDIAAHRAAIEAGISTIIVPTHGLDRIYPTIHRQVAISALENGGLLTEYPSETPPERLNFVARNRIVAGMADAVVIVESKRTGGSLITACNAIDYSRNVYAFPGRPKDENAQGCNELIRTQRAMLINDANDLIQDMHWETTHKPVQTELDLFAQLDIIEKKLIQTLREAEEGLHVNQIVEQLSLPYAQIASSLMILEMNGFVKLLPGNIYRAIK